MTNSKLKFVSKGRDTAVNFMPVIVFGIILHIALNVFTQAIPIISQTKYYSGLLIVELLMSCFAIYKCQSQISMQNNNLDIVIYLGITQIIAYFANLFYENFDCFDIHRLSAFLIMVICTYCFAWNSKVEKIELEKFLDTFILITVIACIYNTIVNWLYIQSFNPLIMMSYTNRFTSFFQTRSNYCLFLCIAVAISLYKYRTSKKILYIALISFFTLNIIMTNARTSIITLVLMFLLHIFLTTKNKTTYLLFLPILFAVFIFSPIPWERFIGSLDSFTEKYYLLFSRASASDDFSNGRMELWKFAFEDINPLNFVIGHGIGSKDAYLMFINASAASFHSIWIDLFFEGGLLFVVLYICLIAKIIKTVKTSLLNNDLKNMFYVFMSILIVSGFGDAIALPFMLDTSVIISTLLFITLPIASSNR